MANSDLKNEVKQAKVKLWRIAERLGMSDFSFSRKLRWELPEDEKTKIREIISEIIKVKS